jgi:hypothetical protein
MAEPTEHDFVEFPVLKGMRERGIPLTRENYIKREFIGLPIPNPWTAADEADLPEFLQDYTLFPQLNPNG